MLMVLVLVSLMDQRLVPSLGFGWEIQRVNMWGLRLAKNRC